jgi:hypothetical protein
MGLKVVHINRVELSKKAEAKAMWENILKSKWEDQARDRGTKLLAELKHTQPRTPDLRPQQCEVNCSKNFDS